MTGSGAKAWFIDAWAVHDGKVFASRRPPESTDADATVFMSVPDLEAVPVGRISTALRATRGGFQEGLRTNDSDLAEIPFKDLRQVRDLVRRAYLAASLGPGSPGAIAGILPRPPDVGPGAGGNFLGADGPGMQEPWARIYLSEAAPPPDLDRAVDTVAQATILEWDRYLASQDPDEIRGLVGWLGALTSAGITPCGAGAPSGAPFPFSLLGLADRYGARNLSATLQDVLDTRWVPGFPPVFPPEFGYWVSGYWSRSHLAAVPLPAAQDWPAKVRRLADMSTLPLIDRRLWESSAHPMTSLDVAPLVLCHAIRQPPRWGHLPGERSAAQAAYDRARASMAWLEIELEEFIDSCLAGPPTGAPAGSPAPSGPSAPSPAGSSPAGSSPRWEPPPQAMSATAG
jgi:hypothetical protein